MFGFRIWGKFAAFRDPLTITQNLSLPIPPKTTVGGIMAAILGIDYNDYFEDEDFFQFEYSLILTKPVRKKSFVQNYIGDYTGISATKCNTIATLLVVFYFQTNDLKNVQILMTQLLS